jgi:hypothetical protein
MYLEPKPRLNLMGHRVGPHKEENVTKGGNLPPMRANNHPTYTTRKSNYMVSTTLRFF